MMNVLKYFRKVALAIWVGKIVFFVAAIAATVFRVLERQDAARLQAQIFPKYFALGFGAATVVLVVSLLQYIPLANRTRRLGLLLGLSAVAVGVYAFSLWHLTPEILRLQPEVLALPKDSTTPVALEFAAIHKLSTSLNGLVFVLGLICLALI